MLTPARSTPETDDVARFEIAGAAVLGMSLATGFLTQQTPRSTTLFSLFDEGNWLRDAGFLILLRLTVIVCFFLFPFHRRLYAFAGIFLGISWVLLYSIAGAFVLPLGFSCAFFYFTFKKSAADRRTAATVMLALTFLLSALQKMHGPYFSGAEFEPTGSFLSFIYAWGFPFDALSAGLRSFMAVASIIVELGICVGLLVSPVIFVHAALIFALVLALIHPPVIFVYGIFFPFAVLIDHKWSAKLIHSVPALALRQPFFWCVATIFSFVGTSAFTTTAYKIVPVAIALLVYHLRILGRLIPGRQFSVIDLRAFTKDPRLMIAPGLGVVTSIAFALGAPSPIGFSMFSGRKLGTGSHSIKVSDREICKSMFNEWHFSLVVDAGYREHHDGSCVVLFPTLSGLQGIRDGLCRLSPTAEWTARYRGSDNSFSENCDQHRSRVESSP